MPNVSSSISPDLTQFRTEFCYTQAMSTVLKENEASLRAIFASFADGGGAQTGKAAMLLTFPEWAEMLRDLDLLDDDFTGREATLSFVWSRML